MTGIILMSDPGVAAVPVEDNGELRNLGEEARDLLATALTTAGLVNYPTEWWHWSYGDRYWALTTGAERALYGPADPGSAR